MPAPGPLVFLCLALCSRKLRRPDASGGSVVPPPEGLSANTRPNCRGPVFLNPSLPLLHRLSPASTLLRRDPTSAWTSAGRRCLLPAYRSHPSLTRDGVPFADPCRPPRVRTLDVLPLPAPIPLRSRLDFGRRVPWHAHPIGPACTGLHLRSVLQRPYGFFPTPPHGRAVAFGLRLLPTCSAEDLHLQSRVHAWHTKGARVARIAFGDESP